LAVGDRKLPARNSAWGFSSAFLIMGVTEFVARVLILFGIRATSRSLEAVTTE
jgi:hypothetical protein